MFEIRAISRDDHERYRSGRDHLGQPAEVVLHDDDDGGAPLRCCLTEAKAGERLLLVAHRPFDESGPYAEVGPIFVHADDCGGRSPSSAYPEDFRHRAQVFRSYDHEGRIHDAEIVEGADAESAIARLLADPDVAYIHSRNVLYGCYMFTISRSTSSRRS